MSRRILMGIVMMAMSMSLVPVAGIGTAATAQEPDDGRAQLVERRLTEGLTREQLAGLYESLTLAEFEPPACVAGSEMFDDVPATNPFCPWIEELSRRGITGGCTATNYCPTNPVTRAQMAIFILRATADEDPHVVGAPGEPAFGNGGDGDCFWQNPPPAAGFLNAANPTSFYKDSDGIVHLAGVAFAAPGPLGDGMCDGADISDLIIFQLPDGYQPEHLEVFVSGNSTIGINLIAPQGGLEVAPGVIIPGGSVLASTIADGDGTTLDGFTFRAAPAETTLSARREPTSISLQALRDMFN